MISQPCPDKKWRKLLFNFVDQQKQRKMQETNSKPFYRGQRVNIDGVPCVYHNTSDDGISHFFRSATDGDLVTVYEKEQYSFIPSRYCKKAVMSSENQKFVGFWVMSEKRKDEPSPEKLKLTSLNEELAVIAERIQQEVRKAEEAIIDYNEANRGEIPVCTFASISFRSKFVELDRTMGEKSVKCDIEIITPATEADELRDNIKLRYDEQGN